MRKLGRTATGVALMLPLAVAPLAAQNAVPWRFDVGVNGGGSWYSSLLNDQSMLGADGADNVRFRSNWLSGAQATLWITPRIGVRANMTYTDTDLKQGNSLFSQENTLYGDVNLWSGTGDLMLRLTHPSDTYTGFAALPYVALGAGLKWVNPAGDFYSETETSDAETVTGVPFNCNAGTCAGPAATPATGSNSFFLRESSSFMGLVGLGTDLRLARNFGVRLEVGDRIYKPGLVQVGNAGYPTAVTAVNEDKIGNTVHEVYAQAGLHMLLGIASPPVVAIAPQPAPEPVTPPDTTTPAPPPPAPTTETVNVCAVDVTQPTGLRTITATHNLTTNDTTVTMNGQDMPLSQAVGTVPVAANATWYVQGQPLTIGTGNASVQYVAFGSPQTMTPDQLTFIGTVDGLPVYVPTSSATSLEGVNGQTDLSQWVGTTANRKALENVNVLYVPLQPTGCTFQPVQLQQQVRKVRG